MLWVRRDCFRENLLLTSVRLSFIMRLKVLAGSGAGEPLLTGF